MPDVPFDRVVVHDDGFTKEYTVEGFLALPLSRRVGYILGRQVDFYAGAKLVDRQAALRSLRAVSVDPR